jgi:hypothetical protein
MIRTIITPQDQRIFFDIPKDYVGKQIEVIAFAKDEGMQKKQSKPKEVSFDALSIDTKGYKFNRDEANER